MSSRAHITDSFLSMLSLNLISEIIILKMSFLSTNFYSNPTCYPPSQRKLTYVDSKDLHVSEISLGHFHSEYQWMVLHIEIRRTHHATLVASSTSTWESVLNDYQMRDILLKNLIQSSN